MTGEHDWEKTRPGWGSALFGRLPVRVATTASHAFLQGGDNIVATCVQSMKKKKNIPRACKKNSGVVFHSRTADAPYEAAELRYVFRLLRLLLENSAWSAGRWRAQVTWFGRVISRAELMISTVSVLSLDGYCLRCVWRLQRHVLIVTFQQMFVPAKDAPSLDFVPRW